MGTNATAGVTVTVGTNANTAQLNRYTQSVQSMQSAIKGLLGNGSVAAFGAAFTAGAVSVQAMVSRISEAISRSSALAAEMAQVERRVGLTGEAFQVLSRAGKAASEELIAGLAKYRVELGKALNGDKDARKVFSGLGVSPEQLTALPMERQLELIGAALQRFGDKNREAAEAQKLFGRGYSAMVPVLDKLGTDGYDKLREKVSETAGVLGKDMAAALTAAQRAASAAQNQLSIALSSTNLRLLELKATVTKFLADNAGPIQSAGTGLAMGFLGAATLSQLAGRIGPQINVIGSQAATAFSHGFGVGVQMLPGIIAQRLGGAGGINTFSALGSALATPFGAAFAIAVGGFIISELQRIAMEEIAKRDQQSAADFDRIKAIRNAVTSASTPEAANKAQADAAKALADNQAEIEKLEARKKALAAIPERYNKMTDLPVARPEMSKAELDRMATLGTEAKVLASLVQYSKDKGAAIAAANAAQQKATDLSFAEAEELKKAALVHDSMEEREKAHRYEAIKDDTERLNYLYNWRAQEQATWNAKIAATQSSALKSEYELQERVKISDIDAKIAEVRKQAADEAERTAKAAELEVDRMLEKLNHERVHEIMRGLDSELHGIAVKLAQAEGDFTKTSADRWVARQKAIVDDAKATTNALQDLEARKVTAGGMGLNTEPNDAAIQQAKDRLDDLKRAAMESGPDPNNWVDQTKAGLTQLRDSWGTTAQQISGTITNVIGSAVDSLSQNISGLIMGTENWRQALENVGMSILTTVVNSVVQMGVRWVATQIMMAVAGKAIAAASTAAMIPIAMAQSAVWAAPATLSTIASFGGAAAAAPIEIAAAIGATEGIGLATASEGGYFPGDPGKVRGLFHGNEVVFSAPAVENLGADNLLALHEAGKNPAAAASSGAAVGGRSKGMQIVTVIDNGDAESAAQIDRLMSDPRTENHIVRVSRKNRARIGIQV